MTRIPSSGHKTTARFWISHWLRLLLLPAFLALLTISCGFFGPTRTADEVRVRQQEAERDFLYSNVSNQYLVTLAGGEHSKASRRTFYRWDRTSSDLSKISKTGADRSSVGDGNALLSLESGDRGPSIHFYSWLEGNRRTVSVRLSSLNVRKRRSDASGSATHEVLFTARESAFLPFSESPDFELFKARLKIGSGEKSAELSHLEQLTKNDVDDREPTFSPDGTWAVFVRTVDGKQHIYRMDPDGTSVRALTDGSKGSSYHPVVLPDNQRVLYVRDTKKGAEYFTCGPDGEEHRKASGTELRNRLFSWDDRTRHSYMVTDVFANQKTLRMLMELPRQLDLTQLLLLMEWNGPELSAHREQIRAARAERRLHQLEDGVSIGTSANHVVDVGTLLDEPVTSPGDRSIEDLTRYLLSLEVPLFTGSLKKAIEQRDRWQELVYTQTYHKQYSDRAYRVIQAYVQYSEQIQRRKVYERILDLQMKRRGIVQKRIEAGKMLAQKRMEVRADIKEAKAKRSDADGKAETARAELLSLIGLDPHNRQVSIEPASLDRAMLPKPLPDRRRFQALLQVNHPDLARLKFLELRAAAIRDMGPPESRPRPTIGLSYGVGVNQFFGEAIDDFISTSLRYAFSLTHNAQDRAYREQWTHEMKQFRQQRRQHRLELIARLRETREALDGLKKKIGFVESWRQEAAETVRRQHLYSTEGPIPGKTEDATPLEPLESRIAYQRQLLDGLEVRGSYLQHTGQYYHRAGLMRRFLSFWNKRGKPFARSGPQRSMYLWHTLDVVQNPAERKRFLQLCERENIKRIYLFLSRVDGKLYLEAYRPEIQYLLTLLDRRNISTYALLGNPNWVKPEYGDEINRLLRSVMSLNREVEAAGSGFHGVQLDVEPHALEGWQAEDTRTQLQQKYTDMLGRVRSALEDGEHDALPLRLTIPHTWRRYRGTLFLRRVMEEADELSVMSYFTRGTAIASHARPLLDVASEYNLPAEVVVETHPGPGKQRSFATHSPDALRRALKAAQEDLDDRSTFRGFSLHDYRGVQTLMERKTDGH